MRVFKLLFFLVLIIFVGSLLYWSVFTPKEDVSQRIYKTLKEQEKRADLFFKQVSFEEVASGIKYWKLLAETAMVNKSTGIATLQKAEGTFFKKGKAVLKFRSPAAMWDMKKKEIYLDKPLGYDILLERKISSLIKTIGKEPSSIFNFPKIFRAGEGYWFQANNLSWKLADEQLICTGGIVLHKGEVTGNSETLRGDVALEKVSLEGNPRITIRSGKIAPVTVEADAFEVLNSQDTIYAQGNPRVTWEDSKVTSEKAKYIQADSKLALDGSVKVDYKDIQASGNSASYFTESQQIMLEGNAQAQQGQNQLSGEKVMVSLKDRKIYLLGKSRVTITEEKLKK